MSVMHKCVSMECPEMLKWLRNYVSYLNEQNSDKNFRRTLKTERKKRHNGCYVAVAFLWHIHTPWIKGKLEVEW